jgi:hypothetical protein
VRIHRLLFPLVALALVLGLYHVEVFTPPALAQSEAQAIEELVKATRGDLRKRRDSAVNTLVTLEGDQAKRFRPLQRAYDEELRAILDERLEIAKEFVEIHNKLTPETARPIAERFFKAEEARLALHRKYFQKMSDEVSVVAAIQFLQLQSQFETMYDMQVASAAPLATK